MDTISLTPCLEMIYIIYEWPTSGKETRVVGGGGELDRHFFEWKTKDQQFAQKCQVERYFVIQFPSSSLAVATLGHLISAAAALWGVKSPVHDDGGKKAKKPEFTFRDGPRETRIQHLF